MNLNFKPFRQRPEMKLYDTTVDNIKRTTPPGVIDSEWLSFFAILAFGLIIQIFWIYQIEKLYDQLIGISSCFGRRIRERITNRQWNDLVITFCNQKGINFFSGADAQATSYVGFNDSPSSPAGDEVRDDDVTSSA